jgi:hypothetical protein
MRLALVLLLLIAHASHSVLESQPVSQKRQKESKVQTKRPVISQPTIATTKDGRTVVLNVDGSWEFTGDSAAPQISETVKAALRELRKMSGATNVGISFKDYSTRIIDLKAAVEEALLELHDGELKNKINTALDAFVDASTFWNESLKPDQIAEMGDVYDQQIANLKLQYGVLPLARYPALRLFQEKYQIPIEKDDKGEEQVNRKKGLSIIWSVATDATERATQLAK